MHFSGTIYGNVQGSITSTGNLNMNNYDIYNIKNVNTTNLFATGNVGIGTILPILLWDMLREKVVLASLLIQEQQQM